MTKKEEFQGSGKVGFGQTIETHPIPRILFRNDGEVHYVAVPHNDLLAIQYHYIPDVGRVYCIGGVCCDHDPRGVPPIRYVLPVMHLDSKEGGGYKKTGKAKCVLVPSSAYEQLVEINGPTSIVGKVLKITCKNAEYQQIEFQIMEDDMSGTSSLTSCGAYIMDNYKSLEPMFAKLYDEEELSNLLGVGAQPGGTHNPETDPDPLEG